MNKYLTRIILVSFLLISIRANSQWLPRVNALLLSDSLVCAGTTGLNHMTLTYNPNAKKYYSVRIGNSSFPLYTWNFTGGLSIYEDTAGIDSRGIWWNPNTNQVERNCFNTLGWATMNLNASQNAIKTFTTLFTGMRQPTSQSVGAYDYNTNTVLFNSNGTVSVYARNTGTLSSTITLTGISLTGINTESIIYTGQSGYEIGILDYVAKKILLFNRTTGVFTGSSQLPASALTHNQFRISYANNRVWLLNVTLRKWNAYNIWNVDLPVKLLSFSLCMTKNSDVECKWETATEINNDYFTVERSKDAFNFEEIGRVNGAGNSSEVLIYSLIDEHPLVGVSYYRLMQTDFDGRFTYSATVAISMISKTQIVAYPNPASEKVHLLFNGTDESRYEIHIVNMLGEICTQLEGIQVKGENEIEVNTRHLKQGIYKLLYIEKENVIVKLITIK